MWRFIARLVFFICFWHVANIRVRLLALAEALKSGLTAKQFSAARVETGLRLEPMHIVEVNV
jgi:hypothetical protein